MKDFFTKNKWLGFIFILVYSALIGAYVSNKVIPIIKEYMPVAVQEAEQFLPITIENGEIVAPKDTVISKTYGSGDSEAKVVLDTRVDEFEASSLKDVGLYVSRKYVYGVSRQKTEVRSFESMKLPNAVIDSEVVKSMAELIKKNASTYMFMTVFAFVLVFSVLAVLIYTVLIHWLIAIWFKVPFSQTLFTNSIGYIVISLLNFFTPISLSFLLTLVALIAINIGINSTLKENEEEQ